MRQAMLDLYDIQGDVLEGLQKEVEKFIFFKITNTASFKNLVKQHVVRRVTSVQQARQRQLTIQRSGKRDQTPLGGFQGLNLGFTNDGLAKLIGAGRPRLDPSFEKGADHQDTIEALNDPPASTWLQEFVSDRIDGVILITGRQSFPVSIHGHEALRFLGTYIKFL